MNKFSKVKADVLTHLSQKKGQQILLNADDRERYQ